VDPDEDSLPLAAAHRLPVVTLGIGEVEVEAVVDTGFSGMVYLPPSVARTVPALGDPVGVVLLADVHGSRGAEEHRLRGEMRIGDRVVRDPWVLVGEGGPLLGAGFLRSWRLVVDERGRLAALEPSRGPAAGAAVRP
jgi:hypothetical protein